MHSCVCGGGGGGGGGGGAGLGLALPKGKGLCPFGILKFARHIHISTKN